MLISVMSMPTAPILLAVTSVPAILDMKGMDLSVLVRFTSVTGADTGGEWGGNNNKNQDNN